MSLLSACPGGTLLEPPVTKQVDTNLVPFADGLIDGLSGPQSEVYTSPARFKMLCSGRRFGKTHLCLVQLIVWAAMKSGSLNWYIAPTYKSAKQIAWRQLKAMVPPGPVCCQERGRAIHRAGQRQQDRAEGRRVSRQPSWCQPVQRGAR